MTDSIPAYIPTVDDLSKAELRKLYRMGHHKRRCLECDEVFVAKAPYHAYCSDTCKSQAARRRRKERALNGEPPGEVIRLGAPRILILDRDNYQCIYCGRSPRYDEDVILEVDHITSITRGGESVASNLVTACQRCNQEKSNLELDNLTEIREEVRRRNREHSRLTNDTKVAIRSLPESLSERENR